MVGFPLLAPVRKVANFEMDSKQWFQLSIQAPCIQFLTMRALKRILAIDVFLILFKNSSKLQLKKNMTLNHVLADACAIFSVN